MNSEKVKEIKEKLQEEIFIANSFGDKLRKVPTKELEKILTLINELESENERLNKALVDNLEAYIADLDKEGKVVLTREEKEEYESLIKLLIYDKPIKNRVYEVIKDIKQQTCKKTAEKIFEILYQWLDLEEKEKYSFVTIQKFDLLRKFREIYKQFGVEIKE